MSFNYSVDYFGRTLALYRGYGVCREETGESHECRFEAAQLPNADLLLIIETESLDDFIFGNDLEPVDFVGCTDDGIWRLTVAGNMLGVRSQRNFGERGFAARRLFRVSPTLSLRSDLSKPVSRVLYGITNFKFLGTECIGNRLVLPIELRAEEKDSPLRVFIRPVADYGSVIEATQLLNSVNVTCEIIVDLIEGFDEVKINDYIDNLCYLLSVARGTKVQWIYCKRYDSSETLLSIDHHARVTKPLYFNEVIISSGPPQHTKSFVEAAYPRFVSLVNVYKLKSGLIDFYLDAKSQSDYVEVRSLKTVVVIEMLKDLYLRHPDAAVAEMILSRSQFDRIRRAIRDEVLAPLLPNDLNRTAYEEISENLHSVNRTSFRRIIQGFFTHIGLVVNPEEVSLFIACRNALVHRGSVHIANERQFRRLFYSQDFNNPLPENCTEDLAFIEYRFLLSIVDRAMLKLLSYRGPYLDPRVGSTQETTVGSLSRLD